ncbi:TolC family protein [Pyxidicoccus parkwayensis]|uniref:TolC family protein n=1 Tax=Pyxidicoccus parkwayensis TaxID=2813578 RepID=A0ABX7NXA0_9BACT|nr:TolC family protein [Pyxidicoccus parkwaysis]QSQ23537.1 TolC family protein [Pyxidicoccus parkwaysis]
MQSHLGGRGARTPRRPAFARKGRCAGRAVALAVVVLLHTADVTAATPPQPRVITLDAALDAAKKLQPQLRQARAATEGARAAAAEARAPLLPQAMLSLTYERTTANFFSRPGTLPPGTTGAGTRAAGSWKTFNYFNGGATLNQLLWDFGQTTGRYRAAKVQTEAQVESERAVTRQVTLSVRSAYFTASTNKALVGVAEETLRNLESHLTQTQAFVSVGTAPEIDLAQARADVANGQAMLVSARNNYLLAKAQLNQAVGWTAGLDYEVADTPAAPVEGEDAPLEQLETEALQARPELAALQRQVEAQRLTVGALKGAFGPTLAGSVSATSGGTTLSALGWNVAAGLSLDWPIFQGGLTRAQVRQAEATEAQLSAELDTQRLQVRAELEQARLGVHAARASLDAQHDAVISARERLRLAQGRYETGVGSGVELGDAQVALTSAEAQWVQAAGQLATARAQLLHALGRW